MRLEWNGYFVERMELTGKLAVVTGGTSGIGEAIAQRLAADGMRVVICGRDPKRVAEAVERITSRGFDALGHGCDVRSEEEIRAFGDWVRDTAGDPDVLVNNAALGYLASFLDVTVEQIDETFAVNVRGTMLMTREFLPGMLARESGHIVNISSISGKNGFAGGTAYSASKHAVMGFAGSLMLEVRKSNVRVVTVCPGSVETPFFDKAGMEISNAERILKPDDVAETVVAALKLPDRALVSELHIRPTNP